MPKIGTRNIQKHPLSGFRRKKPARRQVAKMQRPYKLMAVSEYSILIARQRSCGKVMFSVMSVRQSFSLSVSERRGWGGPFDHYTIMYRIIGPYGTGTLPDMFKLVHLAPHG